MLTIIALITSLVTLAGILLTLYRNTRTRQIVQEIKVSIDGRMDKLITEMEERTKLEGAATASVETARVLAEQTVKDTDAAKVASDLAAENVQKIAEASAANPNRTVLE